MCKAKMQTVKEITTEEFIVLLWEKYRKEKVPADFLMAYGEAAGWLLEQDVLEKDSPLKKRNAARILFEFLSLECDALLEFSLERAYELADLFDCHSCVKYVAWAYTQNVIPAKRVPGENTAFVFGMWDTIRCCEAESMICRALSAGGECLRSEQNMEKKNEIS